MIIDSLRLLVNRLNFRRRDHQHKTYHCVMYRELKNFAARKRLSDTFRRDYPNTIPVIVERMTREKDLPELDKHQYIVPHNMTVGGFIKTLQTRLKLDPEISIWLYSGKTSLSNASTMMAEVYEKHKDEDGLLYIQYSGEMTFGGESMILLENASEYLRWVE